MPTRIVGFGGRAESGKTTAAEMLVAIAQPRRHTHIEFSDPIMQAAQAWLNSMANENMLDFGIAAERLSQVLGWFIAQDRGQNVADVGHVDSGYAARITDGTISRTITSETKSAHRPLLEWLGSGAITLYSVTVWGDTVTSKINAAAKDEADLITVGGVRSVADYGVVKSAGGLVLRLHRGSGESANATERDLRTWIADFEILNDGTLDSLRGQLEEVWQSTVNDLPDAR